MRAHSNTLSDSLFQNRSTLGLCVLLGRERERKERKQTHAKVGDSVGQSVASVNDAKGLEELVEVDHAVLVQVDARRQVHDLLLVELRSVVFAEECAHFGEFLHGNHT